MLSLRNIVLLLAWLYYTGVHVPCDYVKATRSCYDYGLVYQVKNLTGNTTRAFAVTLSFITNLSSTEIQCKINVNDTNDLVDAFLGDVEDELNGTKQLDLKVEFTLMCKESMTIYFTGSCCGSFVHISWGFIFTQCAFKLSDMYSSFLQRNNKIVHLDLVYADITIDDNCSRLSNAVRISSAGVSSYRALFEDCDSQFNASILLISGYSSLEVHAPQLTERFPYVENLLLKNVRLLGNLKFPWKRLSPQNYTTPIKYGSLFFQLENCTLDEISFASPIERVYIEKSTLQFHESRNISDIFENTKTTKLTLSNIDAFPFTELAISGLRTVSVLFLNGNGFVKLNGTSFENQVNLEWLDLSYNRIEYIPPNMFRYMFRLYYLNFGHNLLHNLEYNVFDSILNTVVYVLLNNNPLRNIPSTQFYSPKLRLIDMHECLLNDESVQMLVQNTDTVMLFTYMEKIDSPQDKCPRRILDISHNNITATKPFVKSMYESTKLLGLLSSLLVKINPNPISCNCIPTVNLMPINISYTTHKVHQCVSFYNNLTYTPEDWLCKYPNAFRRRPMHSINILEEYCETFNEDCPDKCRCFRRTLPVLIIDCQNTDISYLPQILRTNLSIEMRFQNSSLKGQLDSTIYLQMVEVIDISYNALKEITADFFLDLIKVKSIKINGNELQTLPSSIASVNATSISVSRNNFVCDCTNKWLKYWLLEEENVVTDWLDVRCLTINGENKQFIAVPDSLFICKSNKSFSVNEHVVLPSVIIGSIMFVIVLLGIIVLAFRENVKLFIFLYFGFHPFDNRLEGKNTYDTVLIYSVENKDIALDIFKVLSEKYRVADVHKDAVVGMTILDSMDYLILSSRRALFYISEHELLNTFTMHAWRTAYKHSRENHFDFIILTANDKNFERSCDIPASLLRFINNRGVISIGSKFFKGRIEYKMPRNRAMSQNELTHIELENVGENKTVLIYHERNDPNEIIADEDIIPNLRERGINVKWLINEFQYGTDIRYEIFEIFHRTDRLIFILSRQTLLDKESMFILSSAITQSRLQKGIFLLLYVVEDLDENSRYVNGDLLEFLRQYIYINHEERIPVEKLYEGIRFEQEIDVNRDDSENSFDDVEDDDMIVNTH